MAYWTGAIYDSSVLKALAFRGTQVRRAWGDLEIEARRCEEVEALPQPSTRSPGYSVWTSSMTFLSSALRARTAFISSPKSTIRPVT
jgi:hypothetical protein